MPKLEQRIGHSWPDTPKTIVTSFDFGHTEPHALKYLMNIPTCEVRVTSSNLGPGQTIIFVPPQSNFHPKFYIFDKGDHRRGFLIGSANLSQRALTSNTEMATLEQDISSTVLDDYWSEIVGQSTVVTDAIIDAYRQGRKRKGHRLNPDPNLVPSALAEGGTTFNDAVASGQIDPTSYGSLWVEARSMRSGGSRNQLELPRGSQRFFGFAFDAYDEHEGVPVGETELITQGQTWKRMLRWHGDNGMERINLPTFYQSGLSYQWTAILFRRKGTQFELRVAPWDSSVAEAWRTASKAQGALFRIGGATARTCGLF